MTPDEFIATWKNNSLNERAGAQGHFDDLCDLLGVPKPRDPDNYCFERGAKKTGGRDGWADVWKRGFFGWENKKPGEDLDDALKQLLDYSLNLDNPPLLVVSDRERIIIHTTFPGYPDEPREIRIDDLIDPQQREILRWVFTDPERLKPGKSFKAITEEAAARFAALAANMRSRGEDSQRVAHFLVQCLFCLFAEDERLLPENLFADLLKHTSGDTAKAQDRIRRLFVSMQNPEGVYGDHDIPWFNGGLFQIIDIPQLESSDLVELHAAARDMDWRDIDPTIFGTLFERGLDPKTRAPLGAHYTDVETIHKLIDPVVTQPLLREWQAVQQNISQWLMKAKAKVEKADALGKASELTKKAKEAVEDDKKKAQKAMNAAVAKSQKLYAQFLLRLYEFRVLDAACGSGNFLYLALKALRDLEKRVRVEARDLGLKNPQVMLQTGPHNILGLEINDYAAELARVTVWIGDIQWCRRNGYPHATDPILQSLDGIEHRDALLNPDGTEADWPHSDVIVGNPPFLGDKMMRGQLGDGYVDTLRKTYVGRVPGGADLVTYWFEKARAQIAAGQCHAAGLVATNSIRGGANRKVLDRIAESTAIFTAWSDEPWVNEGAAVRVSLVCFGSNHGQTMLNGQPVAVIHADLTAGNSSGFDAACDITQAKSLDENTNTSFIGTQKSGAFDIPGDLGRQWLKSPNPNGRPNSDVIRPWANGMDITRRCSDTWIIDFGVNMSESESASYETPFQYALEHVKPFRDAVRRDGHRKYWWRHGETRAGLRKCCIGLTRYLATPRVSKHRFFVWLSTKVLPDSRLTVVAREDDVSFGLLHSRFHETWSLATCSWHGVGNDPTYNAVSCFETFAFPEGLTPADTSGSALSEPTGIFLPDVAEERRHLARAIAQAAFELNQKREAWLNPPEWVYWVITPEEEQAGFPKRPVAKPGHEADLKKRTLTNLYNARPAWLAMAHESLDRTVASAYGWDDYTLDMPDEEILRRLLALNHERAATET